MYSVEAITKAATFSYRSEQQALKDQYSWTSQRGRAPGNKWALTGTRDQMGIIYQVKEICSRGNHRGVTG